MLIRTISTRPLAPGLAWVWTASSLPSGLTAVRHTGSPKRSVRVDAAGANVPEHYAPVGPAGDERPATGSKRDRVGDCTLTRGERPRQP